MGPRWQATILPVNVPGGAGASHPTLEYGGSDALTTGSGLVMPDVMVAPDSCKLAPPPLRLIVERKVRDCVDAATESTQGELWLTVAAPGPSFPALVATTTPAAYASRNASSTASVYGSVPPEIEKLIARTPSRMAWPTAAAESDWKQPCGPQAL